MTSPVAAPEQQAYSLTEDLQAPVRSPSVLRADPEDVEFEDLLLQRLGPRGWGRVYHFRQYYGPSWGQGAGRPLSPRALEAFRRFLQRATFPEGCQPSVFLTEQGGLELCWEDSNSKSVQAEFTPRGVEFYQEATEQEGALGFDQIPVLAQTLSKP